jgi:hypothetical protein
MLEFEPIEPTESERIWEFDADLDGRIFTYQIKWVERTASHYLTIWDAAGDLQLAGARMGLDFPINLRIIRESMPQVALVLLDLDDSAAPPEFEQLGHRLRFMTYELDELPEGASQPSVTVV